jgi:hypothetical protein
MQILDISHNHQLRYGRALVFDNVLEKLLRHVYCYVYTV